MTFEGLMPSPDALADRLRGRIEVRLGSGRPDPMEEARFEALYRRNAGRLWSFLYRMTADAALSDDLLQKAFMRLLRANPVLASEEHTRRWLFRTATNLAMDHFRENKREKLSLEAREVETAQSSEPREHLRHDMMKTFGELKPQERALLWLAHVEEADHEDIGEALGVKRASVKVLLFRARRHLAELLSRKGLAPEVRR